MKRLLSILIVFSVLFSLASCNTEKGKEKEEVQTTSKRAVVITKKEVEAQVKEGKVGGAVFALNSNIEDVKQYFFNIVSPWTVTVTSRVETDEEGNTNVITEQSPYDNTQIVTAIGEHEDLYEYKKGNNLTSVFYDGEKYFFKNGEEDKGVAIIACSVDAFGFKAGNCPSVDVVNSLGKPDVTDVPDFSQLFFCLGTPLDPTRLTYNFGSNRLDFIFDDDNLIMVTLTDTTIYDGFHTVTSTTASGTSAQ